MQKCRDMRWSGKKYVRRYHKSLNIAKALGKKVTGENYVWYSVRALHVKLLVLLFSLFMGQSMGLGQKVWHRCQKLEAL